MADDRDIVVRIEKAWHAPGRLTTEEMQSLLSDAITEIQMMRVVGDALLVNRDAEVRELIWALSSRQWH